MFRYLYDRPKWLYYILIFTILPLVIIINEILSVFVGGLLVVAMVLAAMYFKKFAFSVFTILSLSSFLLFSHLHEIPSKQFVIQGSIFLICSILAAIAGLEIRGYILKQKKYEKEQCELIIDLVYAFVTAIDAKDHYLHNHSSNVCYYAKRIAAAMGLSQVECEKIGLAALFHDVGKLHVDSKILNKPEKLNEEEWRIMKEHVTSGVEMIQNIQSISFIFQMIKYHHRHYDGSGYPTDCEVSDIPIGARIIAVADSFDAMTSDRPYRKALSYEKTCSELRKYSGSQFDPAVVNAFFEADIEPVLIDFLDVNMLLIMKSIQRN
ncbi:MAG: HD-GYP domain-containing protein [Clostridia bacterium]|nr:HD-GYP domain-containing protein [Clostridia bacterium]